MSFAARYKARINYGKDVEKKDAPDKNSVVNTSE
jgi:hypothetical protein